MRLLIIDDNPADRVLYKRFLSRDPECGYEFIECGTGREGIAAYREHKPDAVLLDYFLADMEGLEVLESMGDGPLPVLMLTGQVDPNVAQKLMQKGAKSYLQKDGLNADILQKAVRALGV